MRKLRLELRQELLCLANDPPHQLALTLENKNASVFRFACETCTGTPEINIWLSSWGLPDGELDAFESEWKDTLQKLAA